MTNGLHLFSQDGRSIGDTMPYYYDGVYHLFYLLNASGNVNVNLEHAWTTDLIHWQHAPAAISREDGPEWQLDTGNIFTGCFLTDERGLHHLWYTSWNPLNPNGREFILHAVSDDLFTWRKQRNEVIAPIPSYYASSRYRDFRDPCVVPDGKGGYDMLFVANPASVEKTSDCTSQNMIFGRMYSSDLQNWQPRAPVETPFGDECPDYHLMDGEHVILSARFAFIAPKRHGPYRLAESGMDGPLTFAGKTVWDGRRHVWFGSWVGPALLTPREVLLHEGRICMRPVQEVLDALRCAKEPQDAGESLVLPAPEEVCMLEADVRFGLERQQMSIQVGDNDPILVDAAQRLIRWRQAVHSLHATRGGASIRIILSKLYAELFVDDKTAFSVPLKRQSGDCVFLKTIGGHISWRIS